MVRHRSLLVLGLLVIAAATVSVGIATADHEAATAPARSAGEDARQVPMQQATPTSNQTRDPWPFNVTGLYLNQTHAVTRETVTTWVNVTNTGSRTRRFTGALMADGRVLTMGDMELLPGEADVLSLDYRFDEPGEYDLTVNSKPVGTLVVLNGTTQRVRVVDAELSAHRMRPGYNATVWMTVVNPAPRNVSHDFTVTVDGDPVTTRHVRIPKDSQRQVVIEFPATDGHVAVGNVSLGQLHVTSDIETADGTQSASPFTVTGVFLNQSHAVTGERVTTWVNVSNVGEWTRTYTATLTADGHPVETANVTLLAGESDVVAVHHRFDEPGQYEIAVDSVSAGTLRVLNENGSPVVAASMQADWVRSGYNATVRATVANPDARAVTQNLTVTVDGEPVTTRRVRIPGDSERQVLIEFPATEGQVAIDGVSVGNLNVSEGASTEAAQELVARTSGPGFGIGAALASVIALAVLALRRRRGPN